jgi:hypothetical protein
MEDEQFLHKYKVKQRWGIKDNELVDYILQKGLKAYGEKDGKPVPLATQRKEFVIGGYQENWDGSESPYYVQRMQDCPPEEIKAKMAYFKIADILDFELEHGITPHQEETSPEPDNPQKVANNITQCPAACVDDAIATKKTVENQTKEKRPKSDLTNTAAKIIVDAGRNRKDSDHKIAWELKNKLNRSYYAIARDLGIDKTHLSKKCQYDAMRAHAARLVKKGQKEVGTKR